MVFDVDGKVPFRIRDVHLNVRWGLMPPLGKVPWDVQDAHEDVKLDDALLEIDVHSKVKTSDVLLHDVVECLQKVSATIFLLKDVGEVNGLSKVDMLDSPTVLDEQGDVEVNLCDLL